MKGGMIEPQITDRAERAKLIWNFECDWGCGALLHYDTYWNGLCADCNREMKKEMRIARLNKNK